MLTEERMRGLFLNGGGMKLGKIAMFRLFALGLTSNGLMELSQEKLRRPQ
jgi:hypothetical protein